MAEVDISAVFQLLGSVAQDVRAQNGKIDSMQRDIGKIDSMQRDIDTLRNDVTALRTTLTEYHASVLGHGVMISELEDRVRRIERHLNLPPAAAE